MPRKKANKKDLQLVAKHRKICKKYWKKHIISRLIYIVIGLIIMVVSSLQIILNLFAIRWNEDKTLKTIF